ncbi:MAG TPA: PilZ domain-containing protein [Kofleriaceae bacterium]|nr:PilZ domain-containing protein [Kofleriaceae bacterium]
MGDLASWSERRRALRVPVRGVAVFYAEDGAMHGTIENLSSSGALVTVAGVPFDDTLDVELKLGEDSGWVSARTVRIERTARRWRIAVQFDRMDDQMRAAIEGAIEHALRAAQRRPILLIDDLPARRVHLATRLAARGMTPLAPRTPLEAIDLLTRTQLHVNVCLLAPSFGQTVDELRALVSDSFPWVTTAEISDDVDLTVDRALEAWSGTDVARIASGIA